MLKILHGILFTTLFIAGCDPALTKVVQTDSDSDTQYIYYLDKDSLRQGESQTIVQGELYESSQYTDGLLHGNRFIYYPSGEIEIKEYYENGVLEDTLRIFYENGGTKLKLSYSEGILSGLSFKYYDTGDLQEVVTFENNEENGPFVEYYPNGKLMWEGQYLNGDNEYGELLHYDENGTLIKKMQCDSMAICKTIWSAENGDIELL